MAKRKTNTTKIEAPAVESAAKQNAPQEATFRIGQVVSKIGQIGDYKPIPKLNSRCKGCR